MADRFDTIMAFVLGPRPDDDEEPVSAPEREKGDDDGMEYGDPRDEQDERRKDW